MSLLIKVNGDERTIERSLSVWDFLETLKLNPRKVAVERNLEIVSKSTFHETLIEDGDQLEIVHFIGGG
nr:sulfur carrier protein ThiS [Kordiimonas aquimaris]